MSKIRLLLVDDHQIVRAGLRMMFAAEPDMEIVGEVSSGEEAVQAARTLKPDVVIMDLAMPGMSGIEATRQIKEASPDTAVLALTMYEDEQYFFEMLNAGASGYIPKRAAPDDLVSAIRVVNQGNVFLHATLAKFLMKEVSASEGISTPLPRPDSEPLTPREKEVLTYIAEGFTNREIAEALVISIKTVDRHRENIMRKLNLHNRVELVKYAIEKGLIKVN
ncbi:MAG: DNA-binding response regulator [Chloroflexi bacterium]|nr:MAG: DNA-binding response regulator [Chloroflexota bacterium]